MKNTNEDSGPQKIVVSKADIESLACELAEAAKISTEKASRVLDLFHVSKVEENINSLLTILSDPNAVNALNLSPDNCHKVRGAYSSFSLKLENLRLGIKPTGRSAGPIS